MSAVPYTFAHRSGNILLDELDVNFANVKAYANTAGLVINGNQYNITSVGTLVSLTVAGNISAGNISANNAISVASVTSANISTSVITAISSNVTVSNNLIVTANLTANAITSNSTINSANITVTGNITAVNVLANANVDAANISSSGNVTAINLNGTALAVSSATVYGSLAAIDGTFTANISANVGNIQHLTATNLDTNFIRSPDSTVISIIDGVEVYGDVLVNGNIAVHTIEASSGNISQLTAVDLETNFIRSPDSTLININDGVEVYGDAIVNGNVNAQNFVSDNKVAVLSSVNRTIYVSAVAPTSGDGNDGDIWFQTV